MALEEVLLPQPRARRHKQHEILTRPTRRPNSADLIGGHTHTIPTIVMQARIGRREPKARFPGSAGRQWTQDRGVLNYSR